MIWMFFFSVQATRMSFDMLFMGYCAWILVLLALGVGFAKKRSDKSYGHEISLYSW